MVGPRCPGHAIARYRRFTTSQRPERPAPPRRLCSFDGCGRAAAREGLCGRHAAQRDRKGTLTRLPVSRRPGASQVRDDEGRKECGMCGTWKAATEFPASPLYPDGLAPYCSACRVCDTYRISPKQYEAMRRDHEGRCGLCGDEEDDRVLGVDHDRACCSSSRSCGRCVRGLLCTRCRLGLGGGVSMSFVKDVVPGVRVFGMVMRRG
ncbi:endonuclease domain-containing protein [Streptomyces sp. NPDC088400]|uniref:endonuclease domain-containing protein n=1 Tax=Streptomyces sp. NPDC088400 TaxID=3365861 RepID=UPI0037F2EA03